MQWTALGAGLDDAVLALTLDATGSLYAGGRFTRSGATEVHHVAVWDGAQWQPLGGGVDGPVNALLVAGDDLYVGGYFDTATDANGTVPVQNLARWDGTQWHEVGGGVEGKVNSLTLGDDGILYAGGSFEEQGGLLTRHGVRAWDGVQWTPLGNDFGGPVWTVAWHGGTLYAGGNFIESLGDPGNGIVRWDGQRWQGMGAGTQGPNVDVEAIAFSDRGDLYATGWFAGAGESSAPLVARWDGTQWHPLDGGLYGTYGLALAIEGREVYVGGAFLSAAAPLFSGGIPAGNFARWTMPIDLPIEEEGQPPTSLELHQNYPNPFSGRTTISYVLSRPSRVELVVYDVLGRGVATLVDAWQAAGKHTVVFDVRQLPGGVYFCRLSTDHGVETRSMTVLR
ncbi:T9SS type A sorting domain-containing protein [Rhodocaloribacter litoris]|uniref:T9SS type A sorting domain-containing protein n=1 Tax=Rhodocaloribacter litoris TaxID=2558931 RepID=UPI00142050F3|nr:T9SS type A sorting domain-containing protein [Rhodocaloribacter litoris]QXD16476.1 T9SS type A sorting domain-containing protein [Rhodocaloribacter litoris]